VGFEIGLGVRAVGGVLPSSPPRAVDVHDHRRPALAPALGLEHHPAVLVDVTPAVENQRVLSSELVHVDQGDFVVRGTRGDELFTGLDHPAPERRSGDVHDDLGSARGAPQRRTVRDPEVFADLDGESPEGKAKQEIPERDAVDTRAHAGDPQSEDPSLVEHVVVRKVLFGDDSQDLPGGHHRDGVVEEAAIGDGEPHGEDGGKRELSRRLGELPERSPLRGDESRPLDEVFGGITGNHLLGESGETALGLRGLARHLRHLLEVSVDRADGGIQVDEADLEEAHQ
jgi:hypothetical protein